MTSKWPVFVELCRVDGGIPQVYDSSNRYRDDLSYGLMEAARAWQAFRDWCDGTPEQWQEREADVYAEGENDGFDRGMEAARSPPGQAPHWEAEPYTGDDSDD